MEKREKKVTFSQFQKLGKVLMTPVMILPIAGILVGIGSAFTTKNIVALWPVLGNTYVKLFFNLLKAMAIPLTPIFQSFLLFPLPSAMQKRKRASRHCPA